MTCSSPKRSKNSGSPKSGEPEYLVVGKLRRAHGVHGEILMEIVTDFPERLSDHRKVYVGSQYEPHVLARTRPHAQGLLISLRGIETLAAIKRYQNQLVHVRTADVPPAPTGTYYHHQLLNLSIILEGGELVGKLADILQTGANDVYVVRRHERSDLLLPAIPTVILEIDLQRAEIKVRIPAGMEDS